MWRGRIRRILLVSEAPPQGPPGAELGVRERHVGQRAVAVIAEVDDARVAVDRHRHAAPWEALLHEGGIRPAELQARRGVAGRPAVARQELPGHDEAPDAPLLSRLGIYLGPVGVEGDVFFHGVVLAERHLAPPLGPEAQLEPRPDVVVVGLPARVRLALPLRQGPVVARGACLVQDLRQLQPGNLAPPVAHLRELLVRHGPGSEQSPARFQRKLRRNSNVQELFDDYEILLGQLRQRARNHAWDHAARGFRLVDGAFGGRRRTAAHESSFPFIP